MLPSRPAGDTTSDAHSLGRLPMEIRSVVGRLVDLPQLLGNFSRTTCETARKAEGSTAAKHHPQSVLGMVDFATLLSWPELETF